MAIGKDINAFIEAMERDQLRKFCNDILDGKNDKELAELLAAVPLVLRKRYKVKPKKLRRGIGSY